MTLSIKGRTAIVTGAAGGIGRPLAGAQRRFATPSPDVYWRQMDHLAGRLAADGSQSPDGATPGGPTTACHHRARSCRPSPDAPGRQPSRPGSGRPPIGEVRRRGRG